MYCKPVWGHNQKELIIWWGESIQLCSVRHSFPPLLLTLGTTKVAKVINEIMVEGNMVEVQPFLPA